jgi:carboxy-terminal domain RNA polymerase II polypeptide A small phosphatase
MLTRPLLILDLDETLIHASVEPLAHQCDFRAGDYYVYRRPHLEQFLEEVAQTYDLACWSSATMDYLELVLAVIMVGIDVKPLFIWDRSKCTRHFDHGLHEEYFLKDLKKVRHRGFDLDRVLILEDEPRKVQRSFGNAIYVRPYLGAAEDQELPKLAAYLQSISSAASFRKLEKRYWHVLNTSDTTGA